MVAIESFPACWDDVEKWIIRKCELNKNSDFKTNVAQFINRLRLLLGDVDVAAADGNDFPMKEEVKDAEPSPPSRVSPRFSKGLNELKTEEDLANPLKRSRGRPRKLSVSGEASLSNQQVLTNYFQVQTSPIVDAGEPNPS